MRGDETSKQVTQTLGKSKMPCAADMTVHPGTSLHPSLKIKYQEEALMQGGRRPVRSSAPLLQQALCGQPAHGSHSAVQVTGLCPTPWQ